MKVKNLEKKAKPAAEFDKKTPENRKKSINDVKKTKKFKAKDKVEGGVKNEVKFQKIQKKKKHNILKEFKKDIEESKSKVATVESVEQADKLVKDEIISKAVFALKDGINKENEKNDKKNIFDEELRLGLQIVAAKVPKCPPHVRKILLKHSLFDQQPDVCFIIKDQIPKKGDQDENMRNFQEKLAEAGVDYVKTVIPISKLKQDYTTHNLKLKLCNTYDVFLVESEIAEHTYSILGKHFISKRKRPVQIDTKKTSLLKVCIDNAIKKVSFKISSVGNLSCFEVGIMKMENSKIAENVITAIEQLKEKWPGSWKNISRLFLKPMKQSKVTIPIYYSNINPNDIEVPVIKGAKQNRLDKLAEKLKIKSKKLKIDVKLKRLGKNRPDAKKSKDKKVDSSVEAEKVETDEKPAKKKKNKEVAAVEAPKETEQPGKKKKAKEAPVVEEVVTEEPTKKKKKKKDGQPLKVVEPEIDEPAAELPALEKKKNKNKNKSKFEDINNDDAEQDQISIKKKKKDKKNKA